MPVKYYTANNYIASARKIYNCDICDSTINLGDKYRRKSRDSKYYRICSRCEFVGHQLLIDSEGNSIKMGTETEEDIAMKKLKILDKDTNMEDVVSYLNNLVEQEYGDLESLSFGYDEEITNPKLIVIEGDSCNETELSASEVVGLNNKAVEERLTLDDLLDDLN